MSPIRSLNENEYNIYSGAIARAIEFIPVFRDGLALLNPFYDSTAGTAYTDKYARLGLSEWFFTHLDTYQRASVLLHEVMHVLNNHFIRGEDLKTNDNFLNIAGDFEINCALNELPKIDLNYAIFPDKEPFDYKPFLSFEQYIELLNNDKKLDPEDPTNGEDDSNSNSEDENGNSADNGNNKSSGDGGSGTSPNSKYCDSPTDERSAQADEAGIDRASDAEQSIAKKNTAVRIVEELKNPRNPGNSHMQDFLRIAQFQMSPPKISWKSIFRRVLSRNIDSISRGRADYSYRRVNRRSHNSEFIFPGMVQYIPKIYYAIDTSGSMRQSDYMLTFNEIEGIIKSSSKGKNALTVFTIDTQISNIQPVSSVKDINLRGGGGTDMSVGVKFVNSIPRKNMPDIFVLSTDGHTDWHSYYYELLKGVKKYRHILLITTKSGYLTVTEELKRIATVIDISED